MAKLDKLVKRLLSKPADMRFSEIETIVKHHGYSCRISGKNHVVVTRPGRRPITIVKDDNLVKRGYLIQLVKLLNLEDKEDV